MSDLDWLLEETLLSDSNVSTGLVLIMNIHCFVILCMCSVSIINHFRGDPIDLKLKFLSVQLIKWFTFWFHFV